MGFVSRPRTAVLLICASFAGLCAVALAASSAWAQGALCAKIKLEIPQRLTLERDAFEARLVMTNNLAELPLEDIAITLEITTAAGDDAATVIFVADPALSGVTSIDGAGRLAAAAVAEATDAVLDMARPGRTCAEVAQTFNSTLARHGFTKDSRCGYAIGLSYPPDWGERTMSLRADDHTALVAGMTFHFMPALWLDDGGIEITEPILITEIGCEKLCDTPGGLLVKA